MAAAFEQEKSMEPVRIAMAGFGTVGSGLANILSDNGEWIRSRVGRTIEISDVLVRDLNKKRGAELPPNVRLTTDPTALLASDAPVLLELMGGIEAARDIIVKAMEAGKHVVTANKHLLAEHGTELFELAARKNVGLFYEASVAGGIPIVQTLRESLAGDRIVKINGILNGTANYILSEMSTTGLDFATALRQAQELGYAEADPTLDVDGHDAAHKLVVLIRLAFGKDYPLQLLPVRGIGAVERKDIEFAREFGYRVKLIAQVREIGGKLEAGVHPMLVRHTYLLARVGGNFNAVRVEGKAVGPVMLHGQGAGDLPTGNAVLADVMALVRHLRCRCNGPDNTGFGNAPLQKADILSPDLASSQHYFRFTVADRPGVMAVISKTMADNEVSIAQAVQKGDPQSGSVPIVFLTHEAGAKNVADTIRTIDSMDFTIRPTVHYRIL